MKKTFRQADGSFVTIEGTPEEIRGYERIIENERWPKDEPQQKKVIKGKDIQDVSRVWEDWKERARRIEMEKSRPLFPENIPIWVVSCSQCHRVQCTCSSFLDWNRIYCGPGYAVKTTTVTSAGTAGPSPYVYDTTYECQQKPS